MLVGDVYLNSALIFVVVAVLALSIVLLYTYFRRSATRRDTFLITGLSDAGKTTLYLRLRYGRIKPTHTSTQENDGIFPLHTSDESNSTSTAIHIVDIPGHEKLRYRYTEFLPISRAIIFVVDSATISQPAHVRRAAEYLYDILANKYTTTPRPLPILVVCNKADHLLAADKEKVTRGLESEIDKLRNTRAAALDKQDSGGQEEVFLGFDNVAFKFDHIPNDITFVKSSLVGGSEGSEEVVGLDDIVEWIRKHSY